VKTSILALVAGAAAMFGLATQAWAGEFMAGLYAHGVGVKQSQEGGVDPLIGYHSDPIQGLGWLWKPSVHVVAAVNTNVSTDFVAAGFDWRIPLGHDSRWYVQPGIGMAYTTGEADIGNAFAPGLSPAEMQRRLRLSHSRIDFGSKVLFEPELALGYHLSPRWDVEVSYIHLSNGEILHHGENQGLDDIGVRLAYRFGVR
jgi:lipid A 3-O-deacylase